MEEDQRVRFRRKETERESILRENQFALVAAALLFFLFRLFFAFAFQKEVRE